MNEQHQVRAVPRSHSRTKLEVQFSARGEIMQQLLAEVEALPLGSEQRHEALAALYMGLARLELQEAARARLTTEDRARRRAAARRGS